ncbi:hypothetical protein [Bifidobacterium simiarum]|uniref:hypothetical protein n=1 Tax=Bifidobacterium simiarum TaxID=2045441 RepID=UPI001BDBD074|nr:hypothetical protein [Bifidobacterium simiarum]MBT1167253.1 hypothetical protein [Bifidobacterium simiarum]
MNDTDKRNKPDGTADDRDVWVTLSLPARLVQRLADRADDRGMPLCEYLALIVTDRIGRDDAPAEGGTER